MKMGVIFIKKVIVASVLTCSITFTGVVPTFAATKNTYTTLPAPVTKPNTAPSQNYQLTGWKSKVVANALRQATWFVKYLEPIIGKKAAQKFEQNLPKIADFIERLDTIQEIPIATFLVKLGFDPSTASIIARYIVLVFGL